MTTLTCEVPARDHPPATRSACEAAARLGFLIDDLPARPGAAFDIHASPGSLTLVTGPSGSGKSSLLAAIRDTAAREGAITVEPPRRIRETRTALDSLGVPIDDAMARLAEVGLADAATFTRRIRELSDGQHDRLVLAHTLLRAERASRRRPTLILVDEFATRLDEPTTHAVARCFTRAVKRRSAFAAIIARPDPDLAGDMPGCHHLPLTLDGRPATLPLTPTSPPPLLERIETRLGTSSELKPLARHHYRPGTPAAAVRHRVAIDTHTGEIIAGLVVAMPSINAGWRRLAWGDDYHTGDRTRDLARLNDEVRRIARVIVDPRYRGLGIAKQLVRTELDDALTIRTEAIAAMGRASPFFARAGMRPFPVPMGKRNARLADFFEHAGIEPWRMADATGVWTRLERSPHAPTARRELERWRHGMTTPKPSRRTQDMTEIVRWACRTVGARPIAYAWEQTQ